MAAALYEWAPKVDRQSTAYNEIANSWMGDELSIKNLPRLQQSQADWHHMGLTLALIREAHARIKNKINPPPVLTSATLDAQARVHLFFKCENFQKVGAFKARGATNAVFLLTQ